MHPFRWGPSFHLSPSEEEVLVKRVLETHAPDGRLVDCELLLSLVEDIMCQATHPSVHVLRVHKAPTIDDTQKTAAGGIHLPFRHNIYKLSNEIMSQCFGDGDSHATTMMVFDLLGSYSWDGKLVLVLAALAMSYGELFLITKFHPINLLAASVAMLSQLPSNMKDIKALGPRLTALNSLVKTMVDVTKCIIEFESLPMQYKSIDIEAIARMKTYIHVAAYWVIKGVVASASQIADLTAKDHEKVHGPDGGQTHETPKKHSSKQMSTAVRWELWSFTNKVKSMYEEKLRLMISRLFEEAYDDNQKVLRTLLSLKDVLPLWDGCSSKQISVDVLRSKTVLLLLSKINIPLGKLQLLVQQIYDHPLRVAEKSYEVVWIPFPNSGSWTHAEAKALNQVANTVPWYFICQPWLLSSAVVTYMKEAWNFKDDPLLVVLDHQGRVIRSNAMDMALIWGGKAYPFSSSRETELWEETTWTLDFIMGDLEPLISKWQNVGKDSGNDTVVKEVTSLFSHDATKKDWALVGKGSSKDIIRLHGSELMECLTSLQLCQEELKKDFLNAIRNVLDPFQPQEHEPHSVIFPYDEGTGKGLMFCEECRRPMEKCILYQ
ncbi:hypothetical protein ACLOJK_009202 [Asimina triloba]